MIDLFSRFSLKTHYLLFCFFVVYSCTFLILFLLVDWGVSLKAIVVYKQWFFGEKTYERRSVNSRLLSLLVNTPILILFPRILFLTRSARFLLGRRFLTVPPFIHQMILIFFCSHTQKQFYHFFLILCLHRKIYWGSCLHQRIRFS